MNKIDEGIRGLNYNPSDVLVYNGETITKFIPAAGQWDNGKFSVTKKTKRSIRDEFFDISVVTGLSDRIYLGSILLANQKLMENLPTEVPCKKDKVNIRVNNLLGLSQEESRISVENPSASTVMGKIDDVAKLWLDKYSTDYTHSTILEYKEDMIYSESQLIAGFGLEAKKIQQKLNLNYENQDNKQVYLCRLKQIYYSATMDAPENPSSLIDSSTTWEDLTQKGINNDNPPVYVSNIDFGRTIYIKFETSETSHKVKEAFSSLIKGIDISQNLEYTNIVKNSSYSLVILGGSIENLGGSGLASMDEIKKVINSGMVFSAKSPAYPISYTTTFLKDNQVAVTNTKTDYIETTTTIHSSGEIVIKHTGAYVAKIFLTWEEFDFDKDGNEIVTSKSWAENGWYRTAPYSTVITFKANTRNINIITQGATGLAWEPWRTSINKINIPLIKSRTFEIWGTTLSQSAQITPSDDI